MAPTSSAARSPTPCPSSRPCSASADEHKGRPQHQVTLIIGGEERNFSVRVTREAQGEEDHGSVLTFDDVTELVSAQRTSAWADVARRIAHEIKNPLTPIQLSAERLRRKYGKVIVEDREIFERCTDTIIRQVGDVTRMVDEFSAFARTPKPQMEEHDIRDVVRAAVLDRQMTTADVAFQTNVGKEPIIVTCDRRLVSQAVSNLVKNAQEALQAYSENPNREPDWHGAHRDRGAPQRRPCRHRGDRQRTGTAQAQPQPSARALRHHQGQQGHRPRSCHRQKSVEQHGGTLSLEDAPPGPGRTHGALIRISLPLSKATGRQVSRDEPAAVAADGGA